MKRILFIDCHDPDRERVLRNALAADWDIQHCAVSDSDVADKLADATVVITPTWPSDMPSAPQLRLLQIPGAGFDGVHFDAVPTGAAICNTFEHEIGMSEYIVLAMLEWQIRLAQMNTNLRRDEWKDGFVVQAPLHGELHAKSVGFIGYGHIAQAAAARLKAFGVEMTACTRSPEKYANDTVCGDVRGMDRLNDMLSTSQFVVITCPLTDETRGLVNEQCFAKMRPDTVVINVARGPIVDEEALFQACKSQRIGGAIIDTWYNYPDPSGGLDQRCAPSQFPFNTLDNVIMSSHASGWSEGLFERRMSVIGANINRLENRGELENILR
ncbi:MAG: NAD(P)-binding domain-containing protein, partial [Gammaproteobacteria bacterium]|nr:NAD(P)-binding domain-containing protein [Gammaproteobacteria bacterium]